MRTVIATLLVPPLIFKKCPGLPVALWGPSFDTPKFGPLFQACETIYVSELAL
jgi:hypothetical protein